MTCCDSLEVECPLDLPRTTAGRNGPETTVPDWSKRLVCSVCGSHDTDMVVTGTDRR